MACSLPLIGYVSIIWYYMSNDDAYTKTKSHVQYYVMITLCCLIRCVVMFYVHRVMGNYGKGLKPFFENDGDSGFWGSGNKKLLGSEDDLELGDPSSHGLDNEFSRDAGHVTEMKAMKDTMSPMSESRSRINSDDFD